MSVVSNVTTKKRKKSESKPQSQVNKCLNEKRRREQENIYIEELAELISASTSDMSSLSVKPDKCAILQETVNQIRQIKQDSCNSDELQQSEVSSSKPTILANDVLGPLLLEALDGFLFIVNTDGKIEFVSENIASFLHYLQDDLVDKSIYNIIHANDHARFSSNLLPMSVGNGFGLSSESNCGISKSRSFNCRFLVKPPEDQEDIMEEKQSRLSQYENMQISAVLLPFSGEKSENKNDDDVQSRLVCVARRIPPNEKSPNSLGVEQFTTRLDITGKIIGIDTSGVSSTYSQYLNKDLVGCIIQDLCHTSDLHKLNQHLQETLQTGSNTSNIYRLRVSQDKYVHVRTKSKHFNRNQANEQEFMMATHSIIRDGDCPLPLDSGTSSQRSSSSPVTPVGTSASTAVSTAATSSASPVSIGGSLNGGITVTSAPQQPTPTPFSTYSPLSNSEFGLNSSVLDMFPISSWDLGGNTSVQDSEMMSNTLQHPSNSPVTNSASGNNRGSQPPSSNSAFSTELLSNKGSPSPAPGRATPYTNAFAFSPVQAQPSSGKSSPTSASSVMKKGDDLAAGTEFSGLSPANSVSGLIDRPNSRTAPKLLNLLTHGLEETDSPVSKGSMSGNTTPNSGISECENNSLSRINQLNPVDCLSNNSASNENVILRELLNQEDEEISDIGGKTTMRLTKNSPVPVSMSLELSKAENSLEAQKKMLANSTNNGSSNEMLRELLNHNDDSERSYRKSQDLLIQQLLKDPTDKGNSSGALNAEAAQSSKNDAILKQLSLEMDSSSPSPTLSCMIDGPVAKRKSPDDRPPTDNVSKRPNLSLSHKAHLAVQNPMLTLMLAQKPQTPPSIPTTMTSSIVSQLPSERLPKDLGTKLKVTQCTMTATTISTTTTITTNNSQVQSSGRLTTPPHQQDVVNSDSRGRMIVTQPTLLQNVPQRYSQPQILSKILIGGDLNQQSRQFSTQVSTQQPTTIPPQILRTNSYEQYSRPTQQSAVLNTSIGLRDMLGERSLSVPSPPTSSSQSSDPLLSEILDEVYYKVQLTNIETPDNSAILKYLDEVLDPSISTESSRVTEATLQDVNAKIAINAIQENLMSFERAPSSSPSIPPNPGTVPIQSLVSAQAQPPPPVASPVPTPSQLSPNSVVNYNSFSPVSQPPSYNSTIVQGQRPRGPIPGGSMIPSNQSVAALAALQRAQLPQYGTAGMGSSGLSTNISPQVIQFLKMRKTLMERRQKQALQHHQKRLLATQQQQQLTMQTQQPLPDSLNPAGTSPFPENINELLNNTVAPNVTLQRSTSIPERLSPRYSTNVMGQIPSPVGQPPPAPSQLSPGHRVGQQQSPYSPLSQHPFPSPSAQATSYQQSQQHRLSPHSLPSYSQGGPSHSPSPVPSGISGGSRSPHLQLSPQQGSVPPQWNQRAPQSPIQQGNLQQQNPMLNAQLSQQNSFNGQPRFPNQPQRQIMRSMPSPGSMQASRNSPFPGQPDAVFDPLSPVNVYQGQQQPQQQQQQHQQQQQQQHQQQQQQQQQHQQQQHQLQQQQLQQQQLQQHLQQQQQRLQRVMSVPGRVNSPRTAQGSFVSGEPLLSPQPQSSPGYSQSLPNTPSGPTGNNPPTNYAFAHDGSHFNFDQQSLQVFTATPNERGRTGNGGGPVSSECIRQELRAIVGARTQQRQQQAGQSQQVLHQLSLGAASPPTSSQSLRADLEAMGITLEISGDGQPDSPLFSHQPLLTIAGGQDNRPPSLPGITSPRGEEIKPNDQKKSLLQQLLSEPTTT